MIFQTWHKITPNLRNEFKLTDKVSLRQIHPESGHSTALRPPTLKTSSPPPPLPAPDLTAGTSAGQADRGDILVRLVDTRFS